MVQRAYLCCLSRYSGSTYYDALINVKRIIVCEVTNSNFWQLSLQYVFIYLAVSTEELPLYWLCQNYLECTHYIFNHCRHIALILSICTRFCRALFYISTQTFKQVRWHSLCIHVRVSDQDSLLVYKTNKPLLHGNSFWI